MSRDWVNNQISSDFVNDLTCTNGRKWDRRVWVFLTHFERLSHNLLDFDNVSLTNEMKDLLTLEVAWLGHYHAWVRLGTYRCRRWTLMPLTTKSVFVSTTFTFWTTWSYDSRIGLTINFFCLSLPTASFLTQGLAFSFNSLTCCFQNGLWYS